MLDLRLGTRRADEFQPILVRRLRGRRENFERYLAAVPDVAPPECDRLD